MEKGFIFNKFFSKKVTIFRWQLNLFGFLMFCTGIIATFTFISKQYLFPKIFATDSWVQTDWSEGQGTSTINQYSLASGIDVTNTLGQISLTNTEKFNNVGFETDLSSWSSLSATGGTITTVNGYTIHTFTSSGSFVVSGAGDVEVLVVAGGGGGGGNHGGGGGGVSNSLKISMGLF
jgi:hypothetical protein